MHYDGDTDCAEIVNKSLIFKVAVFCITAKTAPLLNKVSNYVSSLLQRKELRR